MEFNINRLINQIKWDVAEYGKLLLVGFGVVFGIQTLRTFLGIADGNFSHGSFHTGSFSLLLMIGGIVFTSLIFNELNRPQSRQFYLTLPSSHLEKFTSKLLISTIGFVVFTVSSYFLFSVFNSFMAKLLGGYDVEIFNPFRNGNLQLIKTYLVIQSIFLLGAVFFRQFSFLKTGLALLVLFLVLSFIWGSFFSLSFFNLIQGDMDFNFNGEDFDFNSAEWFKGYIKVLEYLFWFALAPIMWIISYFNLTEKEV